MRPRYRIVRDEFLGFEVQWWRWWWPFWVMPKCNTLRTVEEAREWAGRWEDMRNPNRVVEYLEPRA